MEIREDEEVVRVMLREGDALAAVPASHRPLVTPEIQAWWRSPRDAMMRIADHALGPQMATWFRTMAERGEWSLNLYTTSYDLHRAGFEFSAPGIRRAEVGLPATEPLPEQLPSDLAAHYRLVGYLDWMGFGLAGGLESVESHAPLTAYRHLCEGVTSEPDQTFIFGWSPAGDALVYTRDGWSGWLSHETSEAPKRRSIGETIEWIYGELLAGRCPDND